MPNPITNFKDSFGTDLGNKLITKEYLMTVYPQIANQLITPELWVWGINSSGHLGDNTTTNRTTPVTTFAGGTNWKQVASGNDIKLAIKTDGTLWSWGFNGNGHLGDNTTSQKNTPVTTFAGGNNWKQVSIGRNGFAATAIKTDGTLWAWGSNSNGQLGDNTTTNRSTPVTTFAGGTNWKQVASGTNSTAAIKTDGTLWVWGQNIFGNLGDNTTSQKNTPVTTFAGGTNWKQVTMSTSGMAAIKTDGSLWTWGSNSYGVLGDNTTTNKISPVTTFAGGTNWKQVDFGDDFIAAIKTDGTLWIWGRNNVGQLGRDTAGANVLTPSTTFAGGTNWKQVSSGAQFCAAIKTDGTLWTWGRNNNGQLGDNTTTNRTTPVTTFAGGTNWKQVASGNTHTAAIKTSDDLQGI